MNIKMKPINFKALYIKGENVDRMQALAKDLEYLKAIESKAAPCDKKAKKKIEEVNEDKAAFDIAYGKQVEIDPEIYAAQHFQEEYLLSKKIDAPLAPSQAMDAIDKIKTQQKAHIEQRKLDIKA